ncbi:MAG TPA: MFS transporter, partial [Geminicoccaceae bacterium]|nr:MFS transporter [Geminicoccaceae bacterium]
MAALSVLDVALGLIYPLLSLLLEARGLAAGWIGVNAAMTPLGIVLAAPVLPVLTKSCRPWTVAVGAMAAVAASLVLLKLLPGFAAWLVLRFVLGMAIGFLFAITEAWIAALAPPNARGRVMGLYTSVLSLGFATGPFVLSLTGIDGWPPFAAGLSVVLLGAVPLLLVRHEVPALDESRTPSSIRAFTRRAPMLLLAVGSFALFDTAVMALLPLYGLSNGLSASSAATALGVLIVGNVVLQPPIGWLADRLPRRVMLGACAALAGAGGLVLPLLIGTPWRWPFLFLWGAAGFGVYTVVLAELGRRFTGAWLVTGAASFAAVWGVGGIVGPPLAGAAMAAFGPDGLPLLLAACFAPLALVAAWPERASVHSSSRRPCSSSASSSS